MTDEIAGNGYDGWYSTNPNSTRKDAFLAGVKFCESMEKRKNKSMMDISIEKESK
jgi:hypothetical protein